jgi:hypothetical protein
MRFIRVTFGLVGLLTTAVSAGAQTDDALFRQWIAVVDQPVPALEQGCRDGDQAACGQLGAKVLAGDGVARDLVRAEELLYTSCQAGFAWPCFDLGTMVRDTPEGQADPDLAWRYFARSCELGSGQGCLVGAGMFDDAIERGREINEDREAALASGVSPQTLRPAIDLQAMSATRLAMYRHGCLGARWFQGNSCRFFIALSTPDALAAAPVADVLLAIRRECTPARQDLSYLCPAAAEACNKGVGAACDVWIERATEVCLSGTKDGCEPLMQSSRPAATDMVRPLREAVAAATLDWGLLVTTACKASDSGSTACHQVRDACLAGAAGPCDGFRHARDTLCGSVFDVGCQAALTVTLGVRSLGDAAPRALETLMPLCRRGNGVECADIADRLARLSERTGDRQPREHARTLAAALCDAGNPGGCWVLGETATTESERRRALDAACRHAPPQGNLVEWVIRGDEVRYAVQACRALGANIAVAARAQRGGVGSAPLYLLSHAYDQRACYLQLAPTGDAARCRENDSKRAAAVNAERWLLPSVSAAMNEHDVINQTRNQGVCTGYLQALPSPDGTPVTVCNEVRLSSYCAAEPVQTPGGQVAYACGNTQCLYEFVNGLGQFETFDRYERTRDFAIEACLGDAPPRYLSDVRY